MIIYVKSEGYIISHDNDSRLAEKGKIVVGTVRLNENNEVIFFKDAVVSKDEARASLQSILEMFLK